MQYGCKQETVEVNESETVQDSLGYEKALYSVVMFYGEQNAMDHKTKVSWQTEEKLEQVQMRATKPIPSLRYLTNQDWLRRLDLFSL